MFTFRTRIGASKMIDKCTAWRKLLHIKRNVPALAKVCCAHFVKEDYLHPAGRL